MYPPVSHWAWSGGDEDGVGQGWLNAMGYQDFAGSGVVHLVGGVCALVACIMVGPRMGRWANLNSLLKAYLKNKNKMKNSACIQILYFTNFLIKLIGSSTGSLTLTRKADAFPVPTKTGEERCSTPEIVRLICHFHCVPCLEVMEHSCTL